MRNIYTQPQIRLMNQLRRLWEQHVHWTRFFMATPHRKRSEIVPNVIE